MKLSKYKKAILALIIANTLWGASPPIFKWSFSNIHIFTLAFLRFAIPTLFLMIFARKYIRLRVKDTLLMLLIGLTNISLNVGLYFFAIQYTQSINAPIIESASPVFLIIGSILFLREHPGRKVLLGNLIGLTGVLFIVIQPMLGAYHSSSFLGNLLLILSTIASAAGTLLIKKIANKYHPMTLTFWSFFIGSLSFLPFFALETIHYGFLPNLQVPGITGILFGSIFTSLVGYYLFIWGVKYIHASEVSVFTYIDPVAAILVAVPLLNEYPNPIFLTGTLLVFLGVFVAEGRLHYHPFHKLFARSYAVD